MGPFAFLALLVWYGLLGVCCWIIVGWSMFGSDKARQREGGLGVGGFGLDHLISICVGGFTFLHERIFRPFDSGGFHLRERFGRRWHFDFF